MRARLLPAELKRLGELVELDLRGVAITAPDVQRVLEHGARQGSPLYRIAAEGSDAQFLRIAYAAKAAREDRELIERITKS